MEESGNYNSDEEVNKTSHARLVDEVFQLDKKQYVKKPSRTEPAIQVSEFNLVKTKVGHKPLISVKELTKSLKKKDKHLALSRKVTNAQIKAKPLITLASKPQVDRIRRTLVFDKVLSELDKWEAIVQKNRAASQITFPLNQGEVKFVNSKETRNEYQPRYKSELDVELEKLDPVPTTKENQVQFPLSMKELVQRRKEIAKFRAHQSYFEAKAYQRNRIKSKKFHKINRKQKLKEKIKEFEILKKSNPEAALQKLEELEKVRVKERMSLRHRSTGHWARNKHIQAKYNKESRQALAQQLALSRELTQKINVNESSDSENEDVELKKPTDTSNPWIINKSNEMKEFISGYRKFWNEHNNANSEQKTTDTANNKNVISVVASSGKFEVRNINMDNIVPKPTETNNIETDTENRRKCMTNREEISSKKKKNGTKMKKDTKAKKQQGSKVNCDIKDIFDELDAKRRRKLEETLSKLTTRNKKKCVEHKDDLKDEPRISDLSMRKEKLRPEVDEELGGDETNDDDINQIIKLSNFDPITENQENMDVDTNKYSTVNVVDLDTVLPTISLEEDNEQQEQSDQRAFISEAFEDDDIVAEFCKEKQDIIDKEKPQDIDLGLPGWGSWAGKGIEISKRKRQRFIIKMPEELPRKDKKKPTVIISEKRNAKLASHRVSDLPFPFKSVKDFEASVRAPIGNTFVPQTAFRKLIKPAVVVKHGSIIEPMSQDILVRDK